MRCKDVADPKRVDDGGEDDAVDRRSKEDERREKSLWKANH
jgi:hypothetical protein